MQEMRSPDVETFDSAWEFARIQITIELNHLHHELNIGSLEKLKSMKISFVLFLLTAGWIIGKDSDILSSVNIPMFSLLNCKQVCYHHTCACVCNNLSAQEMGEV